MITHISENDLERYYLGMIPEGAELDALEEHLLICGECVDRALASDAYVERIRAALVKCGFGLRSFCWWQGRPMTTRSGHYIGEELL